MAETLHDIPVAPLPVSESPELVSAGAAISRFEEAACPVRSTASPPPFLLPHQHDSWRRATAALEAWRGALLLDPVGSGKTWVALAVAARERRRAVAVVPAILRSQWELAAANAGVSLSMWTHERLSRGGTPAHAPRLVIVDEAHRFRNPAARRVQTLAPWMVGCRVLLLTATPIVNRLNDLITLLRLALPEDALALDGIASLGQLAESESPPRALARVAICSPSIRLTNSSRAATILSPDQAEVRRGKDAVAAVRQLALSTDPSTRRLLQSVFLDAAASSDAAFRAAVRRYRALLLQARDAGGASRAMLRRFAGDTMEQLVFWELLQPDTTAKELPLDDLPRLESLLARASDADAWADRLLLSCSDARPTVCFTRHRATAQRLRLAAGDAAAWVTGSEAGIGPHRMARDIVLAAFGPDRRTWRSRRAVPHMLVATDVAAEGLDLQAAGRIVHVDIPWTAMRIDQREGRLLRLGQAHEHVETVVRLAPPDINSALEISARVERKRTLSGRWVRAMQLAGSGFAPLKGPPVLAVIRDGGPPADLLAVELTCGRRIGVQLVSRLSDGSAWRRDGSFTADLLARARRHSARADDPARDLLPQPLAEELRRLCDAGTRELLARLREDAAPAVPVIALRVQDLARRAAAARDGASLARLDALLRFAAGATTLGERLLLGRFMEVPDHVLLSTVVPNLVPSGPVAACVVAAILFRSRAGALR